MNDDLVDRARVFQTAAWMWLLYLISLVGIDLLIYANQPLEPVLGYHLVNAIPALLFFGLSRLKMLKQRDGVWGPIMVLIITLAPVLTTYVFDLHLPPAPLSNLEGMVLRQLPVLFISLVLVAWHYNFVTIVLYSLVTNFLEIAVVYGFGMLDLPHFPSFYFIIVVRMVCFFVIGIFINQLIARLRLQQSSLQNANHQLSHYASTLENLTVSRERNRMSRELHDTVVHTLSGLSVQLETTKAYWDVDPNTARNLLDQSLEATRNGLQETRRAIKSLRATPLDDLGLVKAIKNLAETSAKRGLLQLDLSLPVQDPPLSPDVEQCLYRVAQEAVTNVLHHAQAHRLRVQLTVDDEDIELVVGDDGVGFSTSSPYRPGHFGIPGIKERAELTGGVLTIASKPNQGTTVRLEIKGYRQ